MRAYSPAYDTPVRSPRRAAVIGAGDTAMDAVRCSIRLGAEEAHIVYRRSEQEKGARAEDYERARDEGVIFDWLTLPQRFLGDENGWVRGLECIRTELGEPDESGGRRPPRGRVRRRRHRDRRRDGAPGHGRGPRGGDRHP